VNLQQNSESDFFPLESAPLPDSTGRDWLDVLPPQANVLRAYQRELVAQLAVAIKTFRCALVQAPTGSGKTHVIATIVAAAMLAGLRVLVLATRTRLVRQLHERLDTFELPHGVLAAAIPGLANWSKPVQIASVDTLYRRCLVDRKMPLPGADVVIFDEAHLALGASRQALLDSFPGAFIFGFTATPAKTSGAALSDRFETLDPRAVSTGSHRSQAAREAADLQQAGDERQGTEPRFEGFEDRGLCDWRTIAAHVAAEVGRRRGDQLAADRKREAHAGVRLRQGSRCELVEQFRQAGVPTEQLTDNDDEDTREEAIGRLETGATHVLVNCFLLSYGIDIPAVECVVLARPTRSVVLYLQAVGRGMRPSPGKDHMILIDHGRVVENLGMPTYDRDWSLSGGNVNVQARERLADSRQVADEKPRHCG
jgi:DNA repair protein RadD